MNALDRFAERVFALPGIRVVFGVHDRYDEDRGTYLAASITYYLIVSVVPAALLGLAVASFVLEQIGADRVADRLERIAERVPGLDTLITDNFESLISVRTGAGLLALIGLVWAGTGGMLAVRNAMSVIFRFPHREISGLIMRAQGLAVLGVLLVAFTLVALLVSVVALTGIVGSITALLIGAALEFGIVLMLFRVFTTKAAATTRELMPGAIVAGVGVAALSLAGSWYIEYVVSRLTLVFGTFAAFIGILVLANLTASMLLHGAEYAAWRRERPGSQGSQGPSTET